MFARTFLSAALASAPAVPAMAQGSPQFKSFSGKYEMGATRCIAPVQQFHR